MIRIVAVVNNKVVWLTVVILLAFLCLVAISKVNISPQTIIQAKKGVELVRNTFVNSPEGIITVKQDIVIEGVEFRDGVMRIRKGAKIRVEGE